MKARASYPLQPQVVCMLETARENQMTKSPRNSPEETVNGSVLVTGEVGLGSFEETD